MTGDFSDGKMQVINRCRLYLQVECLSNVCTANGLTTALLLHSRTSA
jgi:hypothetical protein